MGSFGVRGCECSYSRETFVQRVRAHEIEADENVTCVILTGDDEGNKQLAQYHLAIALYRLQFYQASYAIFSEIAEKPNHLKFSETLLWLAKLATQLVRIGLDKAELAAGNVSRAAATRAAVSRAELRRLNRVTG